MYNKYLTPGGTFSWSDVKNAYDNHEPVKNNWQRRYSGMDVSRLMKKYAKRLERGTYTLSDQTINDNYKVSSTANAPTVIPQPWCSCKKYILEDSESTFTSRKGEVHGYEFCKTGQVITSSFDLSEGGMAALARSMMSEKVVDDQLVNDVVYMAKLFTRAQENLNDAAINFAKVSNELDGLLERVKDAPRKE
jgi:hypothetical protein